MRMCACFHAVRGREGCRSACMPACKRCTRCAVPFGSNPPLCFKAGATSPEDLAMGPNEKNNTMDHQRALQASVWKRWSCASPHSIQGAFLFLPVAVLLAQQHKLLEPSTAQTFWSHPHPRVEKKTQSKHGSQRKPNPADGATWLKHGLSSEISSTPIISGSPSQLSMLTLVTCLLNVIWVGAPAAAAL